MRIPNPLKLTLLAGLMITLGGCQTLDNFLAENEPQRPKTKRLQLRSLDFSHPVMVKPDANRVTRPEAVKLLAFLNLHARAARYTIFVFAEMSDDGTLGGGSDVVREFLHDRGFNTRMIGLPMKSEQTRSDMVRVQVRRYTVTLPGCPDWTSNPTSTRDNIPHSNWGCANAANLGRMLADPADLTRGRRPDAANAELLSKRIRDYQKGETKPLDPEDIGTVEKQQKTGSGQ